MSSNFDKPEIFFRYTSFTVPYTLYRLDMRTYVVTPLLIPGKVKRDLSDIRVDHITYKSHDGVMVPMTIVRSVKALPTLDSKPKTPLPVILYAYGGFGVVQDPHYEADRLIWA